MTAPSYHPATLLADAPRLVERMIARGLMSRPAQPTPSVEAVRNRMDEAERIRRRCWS